VEDAIAEVEEEHREELEDIAERGRAIEERYGALYEQLGSEIAERYTRLKTRFDRHVEPLRSDLEEIEAKMREALEALEVDLPQVPTGNAPPTTDRTWLFDSDREWLEQTLHFRRAQGKD
jgi:hypothetical protein